MSKASMVSSGSYSDYAVWALFERDEDARAYATAQNRASALWAHRRFIDEPETRIRIDDDVRNQHHDPFEECGEWSCAGFRKSPDSWEYRVEERDFYPAGEVPVVGA